MRSLLIGFAVLALVGCKKKDPPVEDPGNPGMASGSGTDTGADAAPDDILYQEILDAGRSIVSALQYMNIKLRNSFNYAADGAWEMDCAVVPAKLMALSEGYIEAHKELERLRVQVVETPTLEFDDWQVTQVREQFEEPYEAAMVEFADLTDGCDDDPAVREQLDRWISPLGEDQVIP